MENAPTMKVQRCISLWSLAQWRSTFSSVDDSCDLQLVALQSLIVFIAIPNYVWVWFLIRLAFGWPWFEGALRTFLQTSSVLLWSARSACGPRMPHCFCMFRAERTPQVNQSQGENRIWCSLVQLCSFGKVPWWQGGHWRLGLAWIWRKLWRAAVIPP